MPETMEALFERLAAQTGEVTRRSDQNAVELRRDGQLFAVVEADGVVELRLRPEIADAARRTPATTASSRGEEWIRFAPPALDDHAQDRAEAWFLVAWRAAGEADSRK